MPTIKASELAPGMVIVDRKKKITVESVIRGESCNGMHVNTFRKASHVKVDGQWRPSLEAGRVVHTDGCYDRASSVVIA